MLIELGNRGGKACLVLDQLRDDQLVLPSFDEPQGEAEDDVGAFLVGGNGHHDPLLGRPLARGEVERCVVRQDRALERLQLGARLDAELVEQRRARPTEGLERFDLPSRAIEGDHQLRLERSLAVGGSQCDVGGDRCLRLAAQ